MSDDKTNAGPADASRINVHEDYEVAYWTDRLGCSKQALMDAVAAAGPMAHDVRDHLDRRRAS